MNLFVRFMTSSVVVALLAVTTQATTLYFDLGDSNQTTPGNYNNIVVNPPGVLSIVDAIDAMGASTDIDLDVSGFFNGSNQSGTTAPTGAAAIFDPQATRDNAFGHALPFGTNPLTPSATLAFSGLDPSATYDFSFFGARLNATDNRETQFVVTGGNSGMSVLDTANNTSTVSVVSGIVPTPGGTINIEVSPTDNNTSASKFYYLGAVELTVVPEPSGMILMFLGLVGLVARRRRA